MKPYAGAFSHYSAKDKREILEIITVYAGCSEVIRYAMIAVCCC